MRLLYLNVHERNAGWGAEVFLDASLKRASVETLSVDYREHRDELGRILLQMGAVDGFLLQRGDFFPLGVVRAVTCPRIFYFSELVARRRDADHLFRSNLFDRYLVRSPACGRILVDKGWVSAEKIRIFLSALDPATYRPLPTEKDIDVLFLGNMTPRRTVILESLRTKCRLVVARGFGAEANALFNRARIVLNIHAEEYPDTETRVFEVLGAGAFLLTERLSEENPFGNDAMVQWDQPAELEARIAYHLSHEDERLAMAATGHRAALAAHTYDHRARELLSCFAEVAPAIAQAESFDRVRLRAIGRSEPLRRGVARVTGSARRLASAVVHRARGVSRG